MHWHHWRLNRKESNNWSKKNSVITKEMTPECISYTYAATPLALQLQQEDINVVRSNRVARKRPARRHYCNGPRTHRCCFEVMYLVMSLLLCCFCFWSLLNVCVGTLRKWMCFFLSLCFKVTFLWSQLSFFLSWVSKTRANLITGPIWWGVPDEPLRTKETVADRRTGAYLV
jgi:hypothetical protein